MLKMQITSPLFYKFDNKILLPSSPAIDSCGRHIINTAETKRNWNINVSCIFCPAAIEEISNAVYWSKAFYIFSYLITFMLMTQNTFFVIWFFFFYDVNYIKSHLKDIKILILCNICSPYFKCQFKWIYLMIIIFLNYLMHFRLIALQVQARALFR